MRRRLTASGVGALVLVVGYFLAWPVPVDPEAWSPPDAMAREWRPTGSLGEVTRIELESGHGPEDIELDTEGRVVAGLQDGRLLRWPASGEGKPEVLADTGGRPLGLHPAPGGGFYVADAFQGLLLVDGNGKIEVLATQCGGRPLVFTDDLETTSDGRVWFTDATVKFTQHEWKLDLVENRPNGRLCVYEPSSRKTTEVLKGLYFANGVAVDPEEQFVLVNETSRYRVQKLWIAGEKAGQHEVVVDNLPGFPDGISTGSDGRFWIAVASPRNPLVDKVAGSPWLRKVMVRLPKVLQPKPARTARVVAIDDEGKVVHDLFDPAGEKLRVVTSVQERGGRLYLGSLVDTAWGWMPVPARPAG